MTFSAVVATMISSSAAMDLTSSLVIPVLTVYSRMVIMQASPRSQDNVYLVVMESTTCMVSRTAPT